MEEMGLRDFIKIIWSAKWLIAIITAICLILGSLYSVLFVDSIYKARAVLNISPVKLEEEIKTAGSDSGIIDFLTSSPNAAENIYLEQVTNTQTLNSALNELESLYGLKYSVAELRRKVSIETFKGANRLYVNAIDENSENSVRIANSVSKAFMLYSQKLIEGYSENLIDFLEWELQDEEKTIQGVLTEITDFESQNGDVEAIREDISNKKSILNSHKIDLAALEISIKTNSTGMETASDLLEKTPSLITVVKAVGDETILAEALNEDGTYDFSKLTENLIIEQVINPERSRLESRISEYKIMLAMDNKEKELLIKDNVLLEKEIFQLQGDLIAAESEFKSIINKLAMSESARDNYQISLRAAIDFQNAGIGQKSIKLVSEAESAVSEGQNIVVIILLSLIAGIMLGVFAAFIKNALKEEKTTHKV